MYSIKLFSILILKILIFFDEVILKHKLKITHFVKVREGCGMGGNAKSIAQVFPFFSSLQTKYLFMDEGPLQLDGNLIERIQNRHQIHFKKYSINKLALITNWSAYNVSVLSLSHSNTVVNYEDIEEELMSL